MICLHHPSSDWKNSEKVQVREKTPGSRSSATPSNRNHGYGYSSSYTRTRGHIAGGCEHSDIWMRPTGSR